MRHATAVAVAVLTALSATSSLHAQRVENLSQGRAVRAAWVPVVKRAAASVVEVEVDGDPRALGTSVGADLVVTKLSQLQRKPATASAEAARDAGGPHVLHCSRGEQQWTATLIGADRPSDLALLRLEGAELLAIPWADDVPRPGALLACPDLAGSPLAVGILSAAVYRHTEQRAFLGVRFADADGRRPPALQEVVANGAAAAAGLQAGDVVVEFEGSAVTTADALRAELRQRAPGERVRVRVRRGEEEQEFVVELGTNTTPAPTDQDRIWGPLSDVRAGFGEVLQHDAIVEPMDCGGPVVDLTGKAVGLNIARAGRVETLALPAAAVRQIVARLLAADGR